jgi:hypothetical protein
MRYLIALTAAAAVALGLLAGPASAATTPTQSFARTVKVTGQTDKGRAFSGRYTITRFARRGTRVLAVGTLRGTLGKRHVVKRHVRMPVVRNAGAGLLGQAAATCTILDLTIRPIDLNLLGLVVHLDRVHLLVTGETGPGNLLGNLLCGLTGILDPQALPTNQLTQLLNGLLGFLRPTTL